MGSSASAPYSVLSAFSHFSEQNPLGSSGDAQQVYVRLQERHMRTDVRFGARESSSMGRSTSVLGLEPCQGLKRSASSCSALSRCSHSSTCTRSPCLQWPLNL